MRYLHLFYFLFVMMEAGACWENLCCKRSVWRWAVFLLVVNGRHVCLAASGVCRAAEHLEMPGREPRPIHGCRPLHGSGRIRRRTRISRSIRITWKLPARIITAFARWPSAANLADAVKDAAVVTQVPELGPVWRSQVKAQKGWRSFKLADFERLKAEFGVDWVLVTYPQPGGLPAAGTIDALAVCQIP